MGVSKGFVYTLEAVIASSIVLSIALFVIPQAVQTEDPDFNSVEEGMVSLMDRNELGSQDNISDNVEVYAPDTYNVSSRVTSYESFSDSVTGGESYELGSGSKELLIWLESGDLDASFRQETVFSSGDTGYHEVGLGSASGYLNFTGSGNMDFRVQTLSEEGTVPEADTVFTKNIFDMESYREVQVYLWR